MLCAVLLFAPFEIWQAHVQKLRTLSPHEINLRRASQPLGLVAILLCGLWIFGARDAGDALAKVVLQPAEHLLPFTLLGGLLLYGLTSLITGTRRCWGARSDGMLAVRSFFKLAIGVGGLVLLRGDTGAWMPHDKFWAAQLGLAIGAASIWCVVVGAVRFLLLTVGGGNALARVNKHIQQTQIVMRPARCRPWWKFW